MKKSSIKTTRELVNLEKEGFTFSDSRKKELSTDTSKRGETLDNKIEGVLAKSLPMFSVKPKTITSTNLKGPLRTI